VEIGILLYDWFVFITFSDGAARIQRGWLLGAPFVNEGESMPACLTRTQLVFQLPKLSKRDVPAGVVETGPESWYIILETSKSDPGQCVNGLELMSERAKSPDFGLAGDAREQRDNYCEGLPGVYSTIWCLYYKTNELKKNRREALGLST
jgi:hypothetical protein